MRKRENYLSRVNRKLPPEGIEVLSVFGKLTDNLRRCKSCGEVKREDEFYVASKSSFEDKRPICIECWDKTKGKYKNTEISKTNDLVEFIV